MIGLNVYFLSHVIKINHQGYIKKENKFIFLLAFYESFCFFYARPGNAMINFYILLEDKICV